MKVLNANELVDLLREIKKARQAQQGKPDASTELLLDFTTELVALSGSRQSVQNPFFVSVGPASRPR